jgi:hypothetical protein
MIQKRLKIVILTSITLLMLSLPSLDTSTPIAIDDLKLPTEDVNEPESAYQYDPNQLTLPGSNVGTVMNSTAQLEADLTPGDWSVDDGFGYRTLGPWDVKMPSRTNGIDWDLTGGTVVASGMSDTQNFIPDNGNFQSSEWLYPASKSYQDNFWGTTTDQQFGLATQTYNPGSGYLGEVPEFVVPGSTDFGSSTGGSGYIGLDAARRSYSYQTNNVQYPSGHQPSAIALSNNPYGTQNRFSSAWGYESTQQGYNSYYSANEQAGNSVLYNYGTAQTWAWGNSMGWVSAATTPDFTNRRFTTVLNRQSYHSLHHTATKSGTNGDFRSYVSGNWDMTQEYKSQFSLDFYYKKSNDGPTVATYSADVQFAETGSFVAGGHNVGADVSAYSEVSGSVTYALYHENGASTGSSDTKVFASSSATGLVSDTICDTTGASISNALTSTVGEWYELRITTIIRLRTVGTIQKWGPNIGQGSSGSSTVDIPYTYYTDGLSVQVNNPRVDIAEATKINPAQAETEIMTASSGVEWNERTIPAENAASLTFGYQIPNGIMGDDGMSGSLSEAKFRAKMRVVKPGLDITFSKDSSLDFAYWRGLNRGYGTGCGRFVWEMNSTVREALNKSVTIYFEVGITFNNQFELHTSSVPANAKVYFRNLEFSVNTIPSAEASELKILYYNDNVLSDTISFIDDPLLPRAVATLNSTTMNLASYWDGNGNDYFVFKIKGAGAQMNILSDFTAEYEYWETITTAVMTEDKIYFELNSTLSTPKPYNFGEFYGGSGSPIYDDGLWNEYWNDNFNIYYIIPKFNVAGENYWNLSWAFDNNKQTQPNTRKVGNEVFADWDPTAQVYVEESPVNLYGDARCDGDIQMLYLARKSTETGLNPFFWSYTHSGSNQGPDNHGEDFMDLDLLFYAPNDLSNIILDEDLSFSDSGIGDTGFNSHLFYSQPEYDSVYVQVTKANNLGNIDGNCYGVFNWTHPDGSVEMTSTFDTLTSATGTYDSDDSTGTFQVNNADIKGANWRVYAYLRVEDVCTDARVPGNKWLGGNYRAGIQDDSFEVKGKSLISSTTLSNTEVVSSQNWSSADTNLFRTTQHNVNDISNPANMIKIVIHWEDYSGTDIYGGDTSVKINVSHFNYRDVANVIVPTLEFDFINKEMIDDGNGDYYIWADPENMDGFAGNVSRGYHEFNVTCTKDGYDPVTQSGNFSIELDTVLEIKTPSHFQTDPWGRHHYDESECVAGSPYTIKAKLALNKTGSEEVISNEAGAYFEDNVFMTYKLTGIHGYLTNFDTLTYDYADFVNESYFAARYSTGGVNDPYDIDPNSNYTWPTEGYMNNTRGDGLFYANFIWPVYTDTNYDGDNSYPAYTGQSNTPTVLEYNVSAYVRVNRTYEYSDTSSFQPNDLEVQNGEGIKNNDTYEYLEYVKIREESLLVHLNDYLAGNFTKLVVLNNESLDGEGFRLGIYDNDSSDVLSWEGQYNPTFVLENYQNNLTYDSNNASHLGEFRIRTLVNCSRSNAAGEGEYKAGSWAPGDNTFYPMGPINFTDEMYGTNKEWMGETEITLNGWNNTDINLSVDAANQWSCQVNSSGINAFTAWGDTYVTPWLNWSTKAAGTYNMFITVRKKGFVGYTQAISVVVRDALTTTLNGSDDLSGHPKIPDNVYSTAPANTVNLTTPKGISVSFKVNWSDTTNYATMGKTYPVTEADIYCIADDSPYLWRNLTGGDMTTWNFINLGNGMYLINISYTNVPVDSDLGTIKGLVFKFSQDNYTSMEFAVSLKVMKRQTSLMVLNAVNLDYYYEYDRDGVTQGLYDPLSTGMAKINFTVAVLDIDGDNAVIDLPGDPKTYLTLYHRTDNISGYTQTNIDKYTIVEFINGSGKVNYLITFSNEHLPGVYNMKLELTDLDNYFDSEVQNNATILSGVGNVSFASTLSVTEKQYYRVTDSIADEGYLPYYHFKYVDTLHNSTSALPIIFEYDSSMTVESNFSNSYRTSFRFASGKDNEDIRVSANTISDVDYTRYIPDITGYPAVVNPDSSYKEVTMKLLFNKTHFDPIYINVTFKITNASSKLFLSPSDDSEVKESVYVRYLDRTTPADLDSLAAGGIAYSSSIDNQTDIAFGKDIYYGFMLQIQIGYFAYHTKGLENIALESSAMNFLIDTNYTGSTVWSIKGNSSTQPYSVIYFLVTPNTDYQTLHFTFHMWKDNYEPKSYNMSFNVVPHSTHYLVELEDSVQYSEQVKWIVRYYDNSDPSVLLPEHQTIIEATIYPTGSFASGIKVGAAAATYTFPDGKTVKYEVEMPTAGKYIITFDTKTLDVRDAGYTINMSIGKEHFISQTIKTASGKLPTFKITSVELKSRIWLTIDNVAPDVTADLPPMVAIDPDVHAEFFVWVQVYVDLKDADGVSYEQAVTTGVKLTLNVSDEQNRDETTGAATFLYALNMTFDAEFQFFRANVTLEFKKSLLEEPTLLNGVNSLKLDIQSSNPNYDSAQLKTYFLVIRGTPYVPTWIYLVGALAIGSVSLIGGFGIKKALQLRIPYVLRMIDESIEKITKDKFPTVGIMLGRRDFIINKVIDYLDLCGIEWEISDKVESDDMDDEEMDDGDASSGAPLTTDEITVSLNKLKNLSPDERLLFIDELKRLDRKEQDEFLESLKE